MAAPKLPQQFGPYTLQQLIARGGMAEIYRATMPGIGGFEKTVAIKKILPHLAENDEFITMLIDEARIIVSISHANIAQVYDLGKIDEDYYIAMEYIHGIDLSTIMKELKETSRTVPVDHALFMASSIAAGLHVAHNKCDETGRPIHIVHRDVSPHNILISFAGDVKIIDFGVAKARGKEAHTQLGVIKGKLLYMAPEQAMAKDIDGRADLFAMGLICYRMLTNHLPFEGDNEFQIYNNILSKEIPPPRAFNPEISEEVNQIVMMLLQRDPSKRYQDGYSAKVDLDRALQRIAPGYSISRLSRWVEDEFSHLMKKKRKPTSGLNLAPSTPSHNHVTGVTAGAPAAPDPRWAINEDEDTLNVSMDSPEALAMLARAKEQRAHYASQAAPVASQPPPQPQLHPLPPAPRAQGQPQFQPPPQAQPQFQPPPQAQPQFQPPPQAQPQFQPPPQGQPQFQPPPQGQPQFQPPPQGQPQPQPQPEAWEPADSGSAPRFPINGQPAQPLPPPSVAPSGQFPLDADRFRAGPVPGPDPNGSGQFPPSGQYPAAPRSPGWDVHSGHVQTFQGPGAMGPNGTVGIAERPTGKRASWLPAIGILLMIGAIVAMLGWKLLLSPDEAEEPPEVVVVADDPPVVPSEPDEVVAAEADAGAQLPEEPAEDLKTVPIEIQTVPEGASIYLNDKLLGPGPYIGDIPQGENEIVIRVEQDGWESKEVSAIPYSNIRRKVRLSPLEGTVVEDKKEEEKTVEPKPTPKKKKKKRKRRKKKKKKKKQGNVELLDLDDSPKKKTEVPVF